MGGGNSAPHPLLDWLKHDRRPPEHIVQRRRGIGLPARLLDTQRRRTSQVAHQGAQQHQPSGRHNWWKARQL
jgi:hypothetical protein